MSDFLSELWGSIFTPGPTTPLLAATNLAFATLQFVLFVLLVATFSIHCLVLSFLCAGLWGSINWFAREVSALQAHEEDAKRRKRETTPGGVKLRELGGDAMDSGDDTETEGELGRSFASAKEEGVGLPPYVGGLPEERGTLGAGLGVGGEGVRKRRSLAESTGDLSTDSEWEKVEEEQR